MNGVQPLLVSFSDAAREFGIAFFVVKGLKDFAAFGAGPQAPGFLQIGIVTQGLAEGSGIGGILADGS